MECLWFVLFISFLLIMIWLTPESHQHPEFRLQSSLVSQPTMNISTNMFIAEWDMKLVITNPNQNVGIHVESLQASLFYTYILMSPGAWFFGNTTTMIMLATKPLDPNPPFLQANNHQIINFTLETFGDYVPKDVQNQILAGTTSYQISPGTTSYLNFWLKLLCTYKFKKTTTAESSSGLEDPSSSMLTFDVLFPNHSNYNENGTTVLTVPCK